MTKKEQMILDAALGKFVRNFYSQDHITVDTRTLQFYAPTIDDTNRTEKRDVRLSRKTDGSIAIEIKFRN